MKNILVTLILALTLMSCNSEVQEVEIKNKERVTKVKNGNDESYYLVYTDKGVFKNEDSWLLIKFDSSDIHNELIEGECYKLKTYFWRNRLLSMYKNIRSVSKINCG